MNKLPQITLYFWIMKICATTLGETAGDLFSITLNIGYAISSAMLIGLLIAALFVQLSATKYYPLLFWLVILLTSTAGTTISDYLDRTAGLGYVQGSALLLTCLLSVLALWRYMTGSLALEDIKTTKDECFYWAAILFSNTLGTALGDFLADSSHLGFIGGAFLIGSLLALIVLAYYFTKISRVLLFWLAFILTRPFGATMGDVLTKPPEKGGLDFGTIGSSAILLIVLLIFVTLEIFKIRKSK